MRTLSLYVIRDDIINEMLSSRLGDAIVLLMALPEIQKQTERHQPHLIYGQVQVCCAVVQKSSK